MTVREMGQEVVDWIHLAQDGPVPSSCEQSNELLGSIKDGNFMTE
jgi:hypothetical protein